MFIVIAAQNYQKCVMDKKKVRDGLRVYFRSPLWTVVVADA